MKITIPKKFDDKLEGNYRAYIDNTIASYSSIIQDNKLEFFTEYTDHGIEHIEDVLNTSLNLLDEQSLNLLNCKDITVLVISVILHDVGMHISSEGLKKVLDADFDKYRIKYFNEFTWFEEWQNFLYEAKRFNDEELENIFGNSKVEIEEPDFDNLNDISRKLCGEFMRRHHARLAHEIVFSGFPSKLGEENIIPQNNIDIEIVDMCGLVARSHGMNLRNSFEYLKNQHHDGWKAPFDIKIIFLMVILRIADYIQIHSDRANPIIVRTKRFSSPISVREYEKHNAIKHINIKTDDPERIYVTAKPDNSLIFLELRKLFGDIQYELDLSWAILGEVYGKDDDFRNLKICFRRLTSNLDDVKTYEKSVEFIPQKIRFDADPELLKLLIGPLYGEDPKYGIRELLQNSVDAIKERSFVDKCEDSKIIITLEQNEEKDYFLSIKDNGIGMTKDTIINFFFRAGASFRNSMLWKKSFVENNSVKIEKTGRFGVGVLAAFLLGEEFELWTKFHKSEVGYYCKASLSTKQVELLKNECEIGTFLKIRLNKKIVNRFNNLLKTFEESKEKTEYYVRKTDKLEWFNWYFMDSPKIVYDIKDEKLKKIFLFENFVISSNSEVPLKGWYSFTTKDFKSIQWTINSRQNYYYDNTQRNKGLFCNGFEIIRGFGLPDYPWKQPIISVFDGNARMPLSLSRDYLLNDRLPFENELVEHICFKIIEKLLDMEFYKSNHYWVPKQNILELSHTKEDLSKYIIVTGDSYTLMTPFIFKNLNIKMFYQLWLKNNSKEEIIFKNEDSYYQAYTLDNDPNYLYKELLESKSYWSNHLRDWFGLGDGSNRMDLLCNNYILNDKLAYMKEKNRLSKTFRSSLKSTLFNERWALIKDYQSVDDNYGRNTERKKEIEKAIKDLNEESAIIKNNLSDKNFYYVKENYIYAENLYTFEKFENVWARVYGENEFLIPIKKEHRHKLGSL